jgi:hypothetical protein
MRRSKGAAGQEGPEARAQARGLVAEAHRAARIARGRRAAAVRDVLVEADAQRVGVEDPEPALRGRQSVVDHRERAPLHEAGGIQALERSRREREQLAARRRRFDRRRRRRSERDREDEQRRARARHGDETYRLAAQRATVDTRAGRMVS